MARPRSYTPELAAEICRRLEGGESLRGICSDEDMPARSTVQLWIDTDHEEFSGQYAHARDVGWDERAEGAVESAKIADDAAKGRLAFDAERWFLSKMCKRYAEKVEVKHSGKVRTKFELTDDQLADIAAGRSAGATGETPGPFIVRDLL